MKLHNKPKAPPLLFADRRTTGNRQRDPTARTKMTTDAGGDRT